MEYNTEKIKIRIELSWDFITLKRLQKHRCLLLCTELGGSNRGLKDPGPFEWEVSSPPEKYDCRSIQIAYRVEWNWKTSKNALSTVRTVWLVFNSILFFTWFFKVFFLFDFYSYSLRTNFATYIVNNKVW